MDRLSFAAEVERRRAECQAEIDAARAEMQSFLAGGEDGKIEPYLKRILIAEVRMRLVVWEVEEDFRFLYGTGEGKPIGILNAHRPAQT